MTARLAGMEVHTMQRFVIRLGGLALFLCPCLVQSVSQTSGVGRQMCSTVVVERRGSDDIASWTEVWVGSGRAESVQHKVKSGSRYRSRSQVQCGGGDCGRGRGVGVGVRSICLGA